MKPLIALLAALVLSGCAGEFDVFADGDDPEVLLPPTNPDDPSTTPDGESTPLQPGFELARDEVRILPFHIRMQKLSRVTGLSVDDPIFEELRSNRYDLGDHNYAQGIGPDLSWNASKMSLWVRSLQPVCASEAIAVKYPSLPEQLNDMLRDAYGRDATMDEIAMYEDVLAEQQLTEAARYQAVCLAVLTSTEFVGQ